MMTLGRSPARAAAGGGVLGISLASARSAASYALRALCSPAGVCAMAVESAWWAAHLASYPWGLLSEDIRPTGTYSHYRTDTLSPRQRGLIVSDIDAAATPILLVHGLMDNRSVFTVLGRALRHRGFGVVHSVNYSLLTTLSGGIQVAAQQLHTHVRRLCERTGSDRVHIVGHSLGGLIARYYVQRLGGDKAVHTLITLGTPHRGSAMADLLPTPLTRQLLPGSQLLTELAEPTPHCATRFLVVWSRMDQLIVPQRNAQLHHPDLHVDTLTLRHAGHLSLPIHPKTVHCVATHLTHLDNANPRVGHATT